MQLPPLMLLQGECAQGGVVGQGELIGTAADRQIQAHPLDARRGVIYDDLLGTTPLETVINTHSVHHRSPAVAGRTIAVAARCLYSLAG